MRLGLLTLLWKRPEVTDLVLSYYQGLQLDGITLIKHAVGSEGETSKRLATRNGWRYTEHPNQPFTDKWNAAMKPFKGWEVEGVVIIGSDNLHNPPYFYAVRNLLEAGIDSIRLGVCHMLDIPTGRMFGYSNTTIGTGRTLSRGLLDEVGWTPWRPGYRRNADGHLNNKIWPYERRICKISTPGRAGITEVGLKTGHDMHTFDGVREGLNTRPVDSKAFLKRYFPSLIGDIEQLRRFYKKK